MVQKTLVIKLSRDEQGELRRRLGDGTFEYRTVPHAQFSVKGEGVVATLYTSGKLVVQSADPELFVGRYVEGGQVATPKSKSSSGDGKIELPEPHVGSDEGGKGDYFGPLVVVALRGDVGASEELSAAGVADSKVLSDRRACLLSGFLRDRYAHAIVKLSPEEYNRRHKPGKLNALLADLHAQAIREIVEPGDHVLVDKFASEKLMQERLIGASGGLDITLHQHTRAERDPIVAAASIIARDEFLTDMEELSDRFAVKLHKGAGTPTDVAGKRFVEMHGGEELFRVAKMHFKNTHRVLGS